jgi:hypothetical protein
MQLGNSMQRCVDAAGQLNSMLCGCRVGPEQMLYEAQERSPWSVAYSASAGISSAFSWSNVSAPLLWKPGEQTG